MYGYIYKTTCLVNGKMYIGQHKSKVFTELYRGSGKALLNAIRKYGSDKFKVELVEECNSREELNEKEAYWISYYNADKDKNFYNITPGKGQGSGTNSPLYGIKGTDNPNYGSKRTEEQRRHMSEAKLGNQALLGKIAVNNGIKNKYINPDELDRYLQEGWKKGVKPFSKEHRNRMSNSIKNAILNNSELLEIRRQNMINYNKSRKKVV